MDLRLRFDPSAEFKRVCGLPQIDEDGEVYVSAFDRIGITGKAASNPQAEQAQRQREQAPSPADVARSRPEGTENALPTEPKEGEASRSPLEEADKVLVTARNESNLPSSPEDKPAEALPTKQAVSKPPVSSQATFQMPGFQAINAVRPATDVHHVEAARNDYRIRPRSESRPTIEAARAEVARAVSRTSPSFTPPRTRSPTPDIRELPSRDWTLVEVVDKETRNGIIHYQARWKTTKLETSYVRLQDDSSVVRYRGADWMVEVLDEPSFNEHTDLLECRVKWQDTWHPIWEFSSAMPSVRTWEDINNPESAGPRRKYHWWRYSPSIQGYHDPVIHNDHGVRRDLVGDEIQPEPQADYTFSLLERLLTDLSSDLERHPHDLSAAAVRRFVNKPLRQGLTFSDSFVASGEAYLIFHRRELLQAALVQITGTACRDRCSNCKAGSSSLPFDDCVVSGNDFAGCCANCVATRKRDGCDLQHDVRPFRDAPMPAVDDGEDGDEHEADAISVPSSPLPLQDPGVRSSVEPDSGISRRTPPTSPPQYYTYFSRDDSPEPGSDNFEHANMQLPHRPAVGNHKSSPVTAPVPLAQSSAATGTITDAPTKVRPSRKRKSSSEAEHLSSPSPESGTNDVPGTDGPSSGDDSGSAFLTTPKVEDVVEEDPGFKHLGCRGRGWPCTHLTYGTPQQLGDDFPGFIYKDHEFKEDGEASEDQVRFVISRLQCCDTDKLQKAWEEYKAKNPGKRRINTRYKFLADIPEYLNVLVSAYCPGFVDLTGDD